MFEPPHCPNPECSAHTPPTVKFWYRSGSYQPKCRAEPVPCFRCRVCGRRFSSQTFRADYRDHKPFVNAQVLKRMVRGVGQRQTARELGLSRRAMQHKMRKIAQRLRERGDRFVSRVAEANGELEDPRTVDRLWDWVNDVE